MSYKINRAFQPAANNCQFTGCWLFLGDWPAAFQQMKTCNPLFCSKLILGLIPLRDIPDLYFRKHKFKNHENNKKVLLVFQNKYEQNKKKETFLTVS